MTWIGRSTICASSMATTIAATSAAMALRTGVRRLALNSFWIRSVDTPTRIDPNSTLLSSSGSRTS